MPTVANFDYFTRYQVYLYELGVAFGRNESQCDGDPPIGDEFSDCRTIYPIPTDEDGNELPLSGDFTRVTPVPADIPANPTIAFVPDPRRRVFRVAIVGDCPGLPVQGQTDIAIDEFDLVEMFVTEPAGDPGDFFIFLEIMQKIGTVDYTDLIGNAKLIE